MDRITAVYDGKALVLQQPVDWPEGTTVEVVPPEASRRRDQDEAFERLVKRARHGGGVEFDRGDLYP